MRTAVRRDAGPTEGEDAGFRRSSSWAAAFRFFACIGTVNLTTRWERGSVSRSALLQPQVLRVTDPRSGTVGSWRESLKPLTRPVKI